MSGDTTFRTVTGPDGQLISVTERGSGHEQTIVLIHGYPDDQQVWDPIAALLAERFGVVT